MSKWKMVKLGDVAIVTSGSTPKTSVDDYWDGEYCWVTPAEIDEEDVVITDTARKITAKAISDTGLKPLPIGTVLLSSRAPIGKVAITGVEMYCNQGFKNLICSEEINNRYLFWYLKGNTDYLNALGRGATFKEVSKGIVEEIAIPLPPLESQREIAKTLDTVSEILSMRKQQLVELDNLIKSIFYDMFGDPVTNEKGWKTRKLGALAVVKSGGTPSRSYLEFFRGDIPWITTVALGKTFIDESDAIEYITEEAINHSATKLINANSILFGIRVGVGKTAINRVPMCTNQDIVAIEDIDSELLNQSYLINTLNSFSKYFSQQQRGATIKGITSGTLKSIEIPIPPIESQLKFAQVVTLVENQKEQVITAVDESQYLFDSLISRYFD